MAKGNEVEKGLLIISVLGVIGVGVIVGVFINDSLREKKQHASDDE